MNRKYFIRQLLSFLFASGAIITLGWMGDLLEDEKQLIAVLNCPSYWGNLVMTFSLFALFSWLTFHFGKYLVPLRHLSKAHTPSAHKVLIIPLSPLCDTTEKSNTTELAMQLMLQQTFLSVAVKLLLQDDRQIKDTKLQRWNGDNFLRALKIHQQSLHKIVMIKSHDLTDEKIGIAHYEKMCKHFCPTAKISWQTADFEDMDILYRLLTREIETAKSHGYNNEEIMLDCTGGYKASSIAAALATLHYKEIEVQYVQTNTREVLAYNMQSMPSRNNV